MTETRNTPESPPPANEKLGHAPPERVGSPGVPLPPEDQPEDAIGLPPGDRPPASPRH